VDKQGRQNQIGGEKNETEAKTHPSSTNADQLKRAKKKEKKPKPVAMGD